MSQFPEFIQTKIVSNFNETSHLNRKYIILCMCGTFNPPTAMHVYLMKIAKKYAETLGYVVLIGIFSPAHESYNKPLITPGDVRFDFLNSFLHYEPDFSADNFEITQQTYTRTYFYLQHIAECVKNMKILEKSTVEIALIGGTDLFASMLKENSWLYVPELLSQFKSFAIDRFPIPIEKGDSLIENKTISYVKIIPDLSEVSIYKFLDNHLPKSMRDNIVIIPTSFVIRHITPLYEQVRKMYSFSSPINLITEMSSTLVRNRFNSSQPISKLVPDEVEDYLYTNKDYFKQKWQK